MKAEEIRFLFAHDRWATRRALAALAGLDPAVWTRTHVVDERGLGGIHVHHLGASQRWRDSFQDSRESPEPGRGPLPTIDEPRERWDTELGVRGRVVADPDRRIRRLEKRRPTTHRATRITHLEKSWDRYHIRLRAVDPRGFEPLTSWLPAKRSTS
jgi:hypothetical protein